MENFIQSIIEGFDFSALASMDNNASDFSNALTDHLLETLMNNILTNMQVHKNVELTTDQNVFNKNNETQKQLANINSKFNAKYFIYNINRWGGNIYGAFGVNADNTVDVMLFADEANFEKLIVNIYSELSKHHIAINNFYINDVYGFNPETKTMIMSNDSMSTPFNSLNFDLLPSHIYIVNKAGENKNSFICMYYINEKTTIDDITAFEQYIESLEQNILIQYEYAPKVNMNSVKDITNYIESTLYLKPVANPDELLKQYKIKMTQKDCDRVSDLIKSNKSADSQAQAISQLTKAVSRYVWYCKLAHINPKIFDPNYKTENHNFIQGDYSPYLNSNTDRKLAFHNCKAFYNTSIALDATDDLIQAAYSKTFTEENANNVSRELSGVNYGAFTPFVLFIDNLKIPYEILGHSVRPNWDYGYAYRSQATEEWVKIKLLDNNIFYVNHIGHNYSINFENSSDFYNWVKNNTDDYWLKNISTRETASCTLQKLRTYILKFLKDKKAGKI